MLKYFLQGKNHDEEAFNCALQNKCFHHDIEGVYSTSLLSRLAI